jgi:SAM-dependent methyltransferase
MPEFDAMAKWYDFDYERRMRKDLPFYRECAAEGGNPVLELGAGTGRITAYLAKAGFDVTGVEISPVMLERGRARIARLRGVAGRAQLLQGDMASLDLRRRFGTILAPFRSFHHLHEIGRQLAALRGIRKRLKPDGVAVIDLVNPDLADLLAADGKLRVSYERKHPKRGTRIVQRFRVRSDLPRQIAYIDYVWDEYRGRRKVGSDTAPMRWRWFHRFEFEHLLARSGLRPIRICGDFNGGAYEADSEEMIFFAVRG